MDEWKFKPARDLGMPTKERLRSQKRENGLAETFMHLTWWSLVRFYLAAGHRLEIQGREHLPNRAPFVLISNHSSHLDALILGSMLPMHLRDCIYPIAAGDTFFEAPILSAFMATCMNALPMWRHHTGAQALEQLRQRLLEEGCAYIIFPEGTRSRDGQLGKFKAGIGKLVAETDVPVVPCYVQGAFEAWPAQGKRPKLRKVKLSIGEPLTFSSVADNREGWQQIAGALEQAVQRLQS